MSVHGNAILQPMADTLRQRRPISAEDEAAVIALPHRVITLKPQEYIVREGNRPQDCCMILSGFVFRHKVAGNGGRQILSLHMKGDIADLQNALPGRANHNLQALNHVEVALIPVEEVRGIAFARPALGQAMWYETLVDAAIDHEWTLNVGRRDARSRMAHLLCECGLRLERAGLGRRTCYDMPMTQEQLADALGLTPVHTNRTLMGLAEEGVISRVNRSVRIEDWSALVRVGDFDPSYLHLAPAMQELALHSD